MLLIIANCSLELSCQLLLAESCVIKTLLPFCKSDYFGIRLGAKSSLSSISTYMTEQHWRLLQINKHERVALVDTLVGFGESGSFRKQFVTSLCNYYFSAIDLLLLLNALVENPLNVEVIQSSTFYSMLHQFLTNGTEAEKESIIELLWKMCRSHTVQSHLLSCVPEIKYQLPTEVFGIKEPLLFTSYHSVQPLDTISASEHQLGIYILLDYTHDSSFQVVNKII